MDVVISKYKKIVLHDNADIKDVADIFLYVLKISLETMGPKPYLSGNLLYMISYYSNELFAHFHTPESL